MMAQAGGAHGLAARDYNRQTNLNHPISIGFIVCHISTIIVDMYQPKMMAVATRQAIATLDSAASFPDKLVTPYVSLYLV